MNNDEYWNKFYSKEFENLPEDPSAFATWISSFKDLIGDEFTFHDLVDEFAAMFEADNERFDSTKFFEACNKNTY